MTELHLPWLELAILTPLLGAGVVSRVRDPQAARRVTLFVCTVALVFATGEWIDFATLKSFEAHDHGDILSMIFHTDVFVIDELSSPLLPLAGLLYLMTVLSTMSTKVGRFSFGWTLISEAILLAILCCREPSMLIGLLSLSVIPPWIELRERSKPCRLYLIHMGVFVVFLIAGQWLLESSPVGTTAQTAGILLLVIAVLLRSGVLPLHCWMSDLFDKASFGTALLFVTPMPGAYAAMRLVLPVADDWILQSIAIVSLTTAVYAAGMAFVQHDARRFFCFLFLSPSSLVLVGIELATPLGLTGALCVWLSVGLSLAGFGLTLRCVEARTGRISLDRYHGLHSHIPTLSALFLLTGLASIGFPGTIGFIGTELLIEGAVSFYPVIGSAVVVATALNGIAVLHVYFRVFMGTRHEALSSLHARRPERIAVLILTVLIIGGGLYPQPGVASRYHAAAALIQLRQSTVVRFEVPSGRRPENTKPLHITER